jgi:hypothetical protein
LSALGVNGRSARPISPESSNVTGFQGLRRSPTSPECSTLVYWEGMLNTLPANGGAARKYHFNWKTISVAAAMTLWNFYFQIFEKAVAKEQVVEFLAHLVQQLAGPLLIVWDRFPAHRSRLVAELVEFLEGQIVLEYLPAYAPELNPVEYLWGD